MRINYFAWTVYALHVLGIAYCLLYDTVATAVIGAFFLCVWVWYFELRVPEDEDRLLDGEVPADADENLTSEHASIFHELLKKGYDSSNKRWLRQLDKRNLSRIAQSVVHSYANEHPEVFAGSSAAGKAASGIGKRLGGTFWGYFRDNLSVSEAQALSTHEILRIYEDEEEEPPRPVAGRKKQRVLIEWADGHASAGMLFPDGSVRQKDPEPTHGGWVRLFTSVEHAEKNGHRVVLDE